VGEADLLTVEDDPCPELSVGKIVQALESDGVARRLDGVEIRGGTGQKGK
jgi:formylmethanofuran dehydrogenase subunit B